jgi:hypothetical protein
MLGAHAESTSVGEVVQLRAYALEDRALYDPAHPLTCSCGRTVRACPFWQSVELELGAPLSSLELRPRLAERDSPARRARNPVSLTGLVRRWPRLYRFAPVHSLLDGPRIGADSYRLFDAIHAVTRTRYVQDSSKIPSRFWSIHKSRPDQLWLIILVRDYRAVACSQLKRGRSLLSAARYWMRSLEEIEQFAAGLRRDRVLPIRYEDLCDDSETTMRRLCAFLELDFMPAVLSPARGALHHLGGSPSKFDPASSAVARDRTYLERLSEKDLKDLKRVAGRYAARWGY